MRNVLNTLRVLEEVGAHQPVGVGELARMLEIPKSSVQRSLQTLHTAGWIRPAPGEVTRWVLTSKAFVVGRQVSRGADLRNAAISIMQELRQHTEETIHLTVPDEDKVVLIERLETSKPVRISMSVGHVLPIHASANGKAILAASGPDTIRRLLATELPRFTDTTVTDPVTLRAELATIALRGYAVNRGEWRSDVGSVAAAVLAGPDEPIASISVNLPLSRLTDDSEPFFCAAVARASRTLSAQLGYRG
jgi:IclR family transcriptional regulator, acetate operon repressor